MTNANVKKSDGSHWYYADGSPCYELPKKDGKGMKVPTLADARKLNLLPGVSTILKVLHKQALVEWMIEQAVLAVLTTPRVNVPIFDGEGREIGTGPEPDDAFVKRVLSTERVQEEEMQKARDRGTAIHDAMEIMLSNNAGSLDREIMPWIQPAAEAFMYNGHPVATELCVVGRGYAGRLDLLQKREGSRLIIYDYKTTKNVPDKGSWLEHRLQLAAYAKAVQAKFFDLGESPVITTANVYISTVEQGKFAIFEHSQEEWTKTHDEGFMPLVSYWQWANNYRP